MPTVTAVIPTYNRAKYICEALDSILVQSRPVDEIIVVDDGSTDNTFELLKAYGDKILYIRQQNKGPGAARNRGIREARGEYIAFLDSDDLWVKDKTQSQIDFFTRNPQLGVVFGDMANFSDDQENGLPEIKSPQIHDYFVSHASNLEHIIECLIHEDVIPTPTVMIKRECLSKIGQFDERLKIGEDYDYWLRAASICKFGFVNTVLIKRRRHESNLIKDWVYMNQAIVEVLTRFQNSEPNLPTRTKRTLKRKLLNTNYDLGSFYFKRRDFASAAAHLREGLPEKFLNYRWLLKWLLSFLLQYPVNAWSCKAKTSNTVNPKGAPQEPRNTHLQR
jgi:glycosyltransferase involved in cell wall biosynthesis